MPKARKDQVSLLDTPYYHCMTRCVRRAYLCGKDAVTGQDFAHRKQWIVKRLEQLSRVFSIAICAYAVMSNHYHVVVRIDREQAEKWEDREIISRWGELFVLPTLIKRYHENEYVTESESKEIVEWVHQCRERLYDLSWFMRTLNEGIARQANEEEHCRGRFWEGRFKSQALLDEAALLTCMMYVDLNPIRAGLCSLPEESEYTAVRQRILALGERKRGRPPKTETQSKEENNVPHLAPFEGEEIQGVNRESHPAEIPFNLKDYLELLDWTGRALRADKKGAIPPSVSAILFRLKIVEKSWLDQVCYFESRFPCVAGSLERLKAYCHRVGQKWVHGMSISRELSMAL